jgi:hypothetical protein
VVVYSIKWVVTLDASARRPLHGLQRVGGPVAMHRQWRYSARTHSNNARKGAKDQPLSISAPPLILAPPMRYSPCTVYGIHSLRRSLLYCVPAASSCAM